MASTAIMKLGLILSATDKLSRVVDGAVNKATNKLKQLEKQQKTFTKEGVAGAAMVTGGALVAKSLLSAAGEVEKYKAVLKTMLGTQELAEKRFKEMSDFAASTPFDLPGVVEMGNKLQALGIYSTKNMKLFGDLAAASGKPLDQVLGAVAKLKSGQKGVAVDMFRDLLITNADWIKATGKGVKANGEMMATTEEMLAAIPKIMQSKRFSGMMDNMSKTYEGQLSNMEDSIYRLRSSWGSLMLPLAKQVIPAITKLIEKLQAWGERNPKLAIGILGVTFALGGILTAISAFGFLSIGMLKGFLFITKAAKTLNFVLWATKFHLVTGFKALKGWGMWSKIAAGWQWVMNASLYGCPIVWIILGIMAVIAAVYLLVKNWSKVSAFFKKLWQNIKDMFWKAVIFIKDLFMKYTPYGIMLGLIIKHWAKIKSFFSNTVKSFAEFGRNIIKGLVRGLTSMITAPLKIVEKLGSAIKNKFKSIFGIHSPSKVFAEFGMNMNSGLAKGLEQGQPKSIAATRSLANNTSNTFQSRSNISNSGMTLTYAPVINLAGGTAQDKESFAKMLKDHKRELVQIMNEISNNNARVKFA